MRDDNLRLLDMYEHAVMLRDAVAGKSKGDVEDDLVLTYALTHMVQIIGEAAWKMSDDTRSRLPAVPWDRIAATRHRLVHDCHRVDLDIVYRVATSHALELIEQLAPVVEPLLKNKPADAD